MPGSHRQVLAQLHANIKRMIQTVGLERFGPIDEDVLMPQLIGYVRERLGQVRRFEREENLTARLLSEVTQDLVAIVSLATVVGGDGVDHYVRLIGSS